MRVAVAILAICAGCFSKPGEPASDARASGSVEFVRSFAAMSGGDFTGRAAHANDLIVFALLCDNQNQPSNLTLTAPEWPIAATGAVFGQNRLWVQTFTAIAPDTNLATFRPDPQSSCNFEALADEFQNPSGGGLAFDIDGHATGSNDTSGSAQLTTTTGGDAIWAACFGDGDCGAMMPFTGTMTMDNGSLTEYRTASDPMGTMETPTFLLSTTGAWVVGVVAIKPQ